MGRVIFMAIHLLPKESFRKPSILCILFIDEQRFQTNFEICGLSVGSRVNDFFVLCFFWGVRGRELTIIL